ncbi:hypothetical protein PVIIG_05889 [Plasmodium vivax India VII]|uniref:Uncharacterized protein n=1 Tax=Plasmodium vivax India VII TaxID=1077284 RepID=A0A0J9S3Z4_PLAVI|nr:hypothetical protein PVIIG_05889 [Plasmodium vivax India VII]
MSEETSDTYYNYNDYCHFKSKFEDQKEISFDDEIIERNPVIETIDVNVRKTLTHHCKKLKEFLSYIDSNEVTNLTKCCSYINYHLTDIIQGSMYDSKEKTFEKFQKFLQNEPGLKSNECVSQMKYLNHGIYKKMKLLYNLYDSYEVLNNKIDTKDDTYFCSELKDLVEAYNEIIKAYEIPDSKFLFMELKNFKCLIEMDKLMSKRNCEKKISDLLLPKEKDEDFLKPCKVLDEEKEQQYTRADAQHNTEQPAQDINGIRAEQGNKLIGNGGAESSSEVHSSLSGTYPDADSYEIDSIEDSPDASPPSATSKTIATTASVAAIIVPSYLVYKVNRIMNKKLNVTAYI